MLVFFELFWIIGISRSVLFKNEIIQQYEEDEQCSDGRESHCAPLGLVFFELRTCQKDESEYCTTYYECVSFSDILGEKYEERYSFNRSKTEGEGDVLYLDIRNFYTAETFGAAYAEISYYKTFKNNPECKKGTNLILVEYQRLGVCNILFSHPEIGLETSQNIYGRIYQGCMSMNYFELFKGVRYDNPSVYVVFWLFVTVLFGSCIYICLYCCYMRYFCGFVDLRKRKKRVFIPPKDSGYSKGNELFEKCGDDIIGNKIPLESTELNLQEQETKEKESIQPSSIGNETINNSEIIHEKEEILITPKKEDEQRRETEGIEEGGKRISNSCSSSEEDSSEYSSKESDFSNIEDISDSLNSRKRISCILCTIGVMKSLFLLVINEFKNSYPPLLTLIFIGFIGLPDEHPLVPYYYSYNFFMFFVFLFFISFFALVDIFLVLTLWTRKYTASPFLMTIFLSTYYEWIIYRLLQSVLRLSLIFLSLMRIATEFSFNNVVHYSLMEFRDILEILNRIMIPNLVLLISLISINRYDGTGSIQIVRRILKLNPLKFPRIILTSGDILGSFPSEIVSEVMLMIKMVDDINDIRLYNDSSSFGHMKWRILSRITNEDINILKYIFFCEEEFLEYRDRIEILKKKKDGNILCCTEFGDQSIKEKKFYETLFYTPPCSLKWVITVCCCCCCPCTDGILRKIVRTSRNMKIK